ncbi:MAG: carboxypeptidase regulatory-like domain-containing protein [Planctomycetes bacterium]|nr:carboxypeptidase regulatory-like domain-containing protein [Planctomycetota bacterium]
MIAWFSGCAESPVEVRGYVVSAHGQVRYHGEPLAGAQLTFHLDEDPGEPALAISDAAGRFRCQTNDSSAGLRPGDYIVTVHGTSTAIPARYSDRESSPLRVTIEDAEDNQLTLEIED